MVWVGDNFPFFYQDTFLSLRILFGYSSSSPSASRLWYLAFTIFSQNHQLEGCGHGACIISFCAHLIPLFHPPLLGYTNFHHLVTEPSTWPSQPQTHKFLCYFVLQQKTLHDQSRLDDWVVARFHPLSTSSFNLGVTAVILGEDLYKISKFETWIF